MTADMLLEIAKGTDRREPDIYYRHAVANALYEFGLTCTTVGKIIKRDHSTVLHSRDVHKDLIKQGHKVYADINRQVEAEKESLFRIVKEQHVRPKTGYIYVESSLDS